MKTASDQVCNWGPGEVGVHRGGGALCDIDGI